MMKMPLSRLAVLPLLCCALLLAACSLQRPHLSTSSLFDLGPLRSGGPALPAVRVSVAEVNPAAWLDNNAMFYRLLYVNDQQPRAYSQNRWVMPPAQLFGQRLKARIAAAGGVAAAASDAPENLSQLRIEADEFTHVFDAPDKSRGQVAMRVSVYNGRMLIAQKSFLSQAAAPSHDASGGAKALAAASDIVINDMIAWLATLPLKR